MSGSGKINDYHNWDNEKLYELQQNIPDDILSLHLDLKTLSFYYINNIKSPILCHGCKTPLTYKTYSLTTYGKKKCPDCIKKYSNGGKSPLERALFFSKKETNPGYKKRILETYEIYYDDEKVNNWAKEFYVKKNRKPTRDDFQEFFGRKFPRKNSLRKIDTKLFLLWDSYLELICVDCLQENGYTEKHIKELCTTRNDFVRNNMFTDETGKRWQIDIYFPMRGFGFEIQDFTTHSRNSDTKTHEKHLREYKHGPAYHEEKRKQALKQGIVIEDLWEDEIKNGTFKQKIDYLLGG